MYEVEVGAADQDRFMSDGAVVVAVADGLPGDAGAVSREASFDAALVPADDKATTL